MLFKNAISLIVLLLTFTCANAQVKLEGDKKATSGDFVRIKVTEQKGKDLKITCLPENNNWEAVKNIDDQVLILFSPAKKDQDTTYYFFAAINNADKTYIATHSIFVSKSGNPVPDPDKPTPNSELTKRLEPYYLVSPNLAQLEKYTKVFEALSTQVDSDKFTTYKQAWDVLVHSISDSLGSQTDLRALRDEVATYLVEQTGKDHTQYNKAKLSNALKEIVTALKAIQGKK